MNSGGDPIRGEGAGADSPALGIALMLCGMAALNSMDAISKVLTESHSGLQVAWARYVFHLLPMVVIAGPARLRRWSTTPNMTYQILRATCFAASAVSIVLAFSVMPFADVIAVTFVSPLIMVVLGAWFLAERVGVHRWIAVVVGFAGMLLMVWPTGAVLDIGAVYALVAALLWAIGLTLTRYLRDDDPWTTLLYTAAVGTVLLTLVVPFFWTDPNLEGWTRMLVMGLLGGTAHALIINAFRFASASLLAPFNYSMLIWATLFGWLLFGELPGMRVATGAAVIIAAGLYVWHRERLAVA